MNEKINLTGPADLLATIPHLLGITPSESFVVLTAHAGALGATLRVDAPEHVEPGNYAQTLTSHAANDDKATASYVVVYTDENQDSYPYAAHVAALVSELAAARMPVRNVWLVTSSYWTEFGTDEEHPLEQITDSHANATFTFFGSATDIDVFLERGGLVLQSLLSRVTAGPVVALLGAFLVSSAPAGSFQGVVRPG
jgi:hypothetical protein